MQTKNKMVLTITLTKRFPRTYSYAKSLDPPPFSCDHGAWLLYCKFVLWTIWYNMTRIALLFLKSWIAGSGNCLVALCRNLVLSLWPFTGSRGWIGFSISVDHKISTAAVLKDTNSCHIGNIQIYVMSSDFFKGKSFFCLSILLPSFHLLFLVLLYSCRINVIYCSLIVLWCGGYICFRLVNLP